MSLVDELYHTYNGRKRLNGDLNKRTAFRVMHELMSRNGFSGWFNSIDDDAQEELIERLIDVVCETIEE